ncbi:glycosyltransferase family 2 protein [Campylobacter upsaliensis]
MIKISIIMPCYNSAKWVGKAIESVLNQTYSNWQLICVDDGSSDETLEILQRYANEDDRILVLHKENEKNAFKARQFAVPYVNGELLTHLDSDDMFELNYLELGLKRYEESGADIVVGDAVHGEKRYVCIDNDLKWLHKTINGREAFEYIIDWRIRGFSLYKSLFAKKYYDENYEGMNADEFLTRILFLNASKIAFFTGGGGGSFYKFTKCD